MASKDVLARVIQSLSTATAQSDATWVNTDFTYTAALGGVPFLLNSSDDNPYDRGTTPWQKQQVDQSQDPGEQTFSSWWLRSQSSFHGGEGIRYLEPPNDDAVRIQFAASNGVNVWERGQVSLLHSTTEAQPFAGPTLVMGYSDSGADRFLTANGDTVYRHDGVSGATATWGGSGTILDWCQDGTYAYVADNTGIYQMGLVSGSGSLLWDTGADAVAVAWAKQRLVAGIGPAVYELAGTGPGLPVPVYTHPNAAWQWVSITDGPDAIYAAGFAGSRGAIFKFTLDDNGGMPVLDSGVVAAELPTGEIPYVIRTYLGSYFLIGTNYGVRVGVLSDNGDIQYGPLTVETVYPVRALAARDRFVWAGVQAHIDDSSGLVRIDLSAEVEPLRFAYANDLVVAETAPVYGVDIFGTSDMLVIGCSGAYLESENTLVSEGYLTTGQVRYDTLEYKQFIAANLRADLSAGSITVSRVDSAGTATSIITVDDTIDLRDSIGLQDTTPTDELGLKFTLHRDELDSTAGPVLNGWQLKALPHQYKLGETLRVPLMCFDFERDENGYEEGYEGWAYDRYRALKDAEANGVTVRFQDLRVDESMTVVLEDVSIRMTSPPAGTSTGWGGLIYATMRQVVL